MKTRTMLGKHTTRHARNMIHHGAPNTACLQLWCWRLPKSATTLGSKAACPNCHHFGGTSWKGQNNNKIRRLLDFRKGCQQAVEFGNQCSLVMFSSIGLGFRLPFVYQHPPAMWLLLECLLSDFCNLLLRCQICTQITFHLCPAPILGHP